MIVVRPNYVDLKTVLKANDMTIEHIMNDANVRNSIGNASGLNMSGYFGHDVRGIMVDNDNSILVAFTDASTCITHLGRMLLRANQLKMKHCIWVCGEAGAEQLMMIDWINADGHRITVVELLAIKVENDYLLIPQLRV